MEKIIETLYCENHDRLFSREEEGCCRDCLMEEDVPFTVTHTLNGTTEFTEEWLYKQEEKDLQNRLF